MCLNGEKQGSAKLSPKVVPQVQEFTYLGSTMTTNGGSDCEVSKRIQAGWKSWKRMTGILCEKRVPSKVKSRS